MPIIDLLRFGRKRMQSIDEREFRIEDRGFERVLKYGGITYSKVRSNSVYTGEYWDYFIPATHAFPSPRVLLIGLGGGTVALQLATLLRGRMELDAVELNRRAVDLARELVPDIKANITVGDGADYVAATTKRYDLILLDAYISSRIPDQFLQRDFIRNAHAALSEEGVLAVNYAMNFMGALAFRDYVHRLKERFSVFKVNTALFEGNVILLCSKKLGKDEVLKRIDENMQRSRENELLIRNYRSMDRL